MKESGDFTLQLNQSNAFPGVSLLIQYAVEVFMLTFHLCYTGYWKDALLKVEIKWN